jgi:hypothetical protein
MSKKSNRKRDAAILLIVVIFTAIAVIGLYQNMSSSRPLTAQEYFQVTQAGIIDGSVEDNGTIYIVKAITVTFKPVRGDAHEIVVRSWANSEPQDVGDLKKDALKTVSLFSTYGVALRRQPQGFLTSIRITSWEVSGELKFFLSE